MFLILLPGLLIILRIFLSVNVAALNVGGSLAKKSAERLAEASEGGQEEEEASGEGSGEGSREGSGEASGEGSGEGKKPKLGSTKIGRTVLEVTSGVAGAAKGGLKIIIFMLDVCVAILIILGILGIFVGVLGIVLLVAVGAFVSLNSFENCEDVKDEGAKGETVKVESIEKQKQCTPANKEGKGESKEEGKGGDKGESEAVKKMVAYFRESAGKVTQDCTDAVQNALDAAGLFKSRAKGGYDMGPQHSDWSTRVKGYKSVGHKAASEWVEGDIISVEGHVYMYLGGGEYGHGGWGNKQTVITKTPYKEEQAQVARYVG